MQNNENIDYTYADKAAAMAVSKTTAMGIYSVEKLLEKLFDDREIVRFLKDQLSAYTRFFKDANGILRSFDEEPYRANVFEKLMVKSAICMQAGADKTDSHIAKMILKGTEMGIIELIEIKNRYEDVLSPDVMHLVEEVLLSLDAFDKDMKSFL